MWRRLCAGLVDAVIWLVVVIPTEYLLWSDRGMEHGVDRAETMFEDSDRVSRWTWRLDFVQRAARALSRRAPTPGERLLGVRWADASTGGTISLHRSIAYELLHGCLALVIHRINRPRIERAKATHAELRRRWEETQARLDADPAAREREGQVLAQGNLRSCGPAVAGSCLICLLEPASLLSSPRRQSVIQRVAGVMVVRERR